MKDKTIHPQICSNTNSEHQLSEVYTDTANMDMTLREHFAGLAMQGFIASTDWSVEKLNTR